MPEYIKIGGITCFAHRAAVRAGLQEAGNLYRKIFPELIGYEISSDMEGKNVTTLIKAYLRDKQETGCDFAIIWVPRGHKTMKTILDVAEELKSLGAIKSYDNDDPFGDYAFDNTFPLNIYMGHKLVPLDTAMICN